MKFAYEDVGLHFRKLSKNGYLSENVSALTLLGELGADEFDGHLLLGDSMPGVDYLSEGTFSKYIK